MFFRTAAATLLILTCLLASACKEEPAVGVRRVAVLEFENLSADAEYDWVGPALVDILAERFRGEDDLLVSGYGSARSAAAFRPTHLLQGYFDVRAGECVLNLTFEDVSTREIVDSREFRGTVPAEVLSLASDAAQMIGVSRREYGSSNPDAIRSFGQALAARELEPRTRLLVEALELDPDFPPASIRLARIYAGTRRPAEAERELSRVIESPAADSIAKAEARVGLTAINGTRESKAQALADFASLLPADSGAAVQAAQARLALSDYTEAAGWYRKAVAVEPDRADLWNSAAYPLAYAGDFAGAVAALERYRQAEPGNPNPYDSLGEIHFRFGEFETAENYFLQAIQTDPTFQGGAALVKAARCRLYRGDREGADRLFREYADGRRDLNDQTIDLRMAQWKYGTGRRQEAFDGLQAMLEKEGVPPVLAALAHGQIAFWHIVAGEIDVAKRHVRQAVQLLPRGVSDRTTVVCQLLIRHAEVPGAWQQVVLGAANQSGQDAVQREALIYAHLLAGRFQEATPLLEAVIAESPAFAEDEWNILLAWAASETGDTERAKKLLSTYPIIQPSGESAFHCLVFPRLFYLTGALAAKEGRSEVARSHLRMFIEYSGDSPDLSGNLKQAKQLLAGAGE